MLQQTSERPLRKLVTSPHDVLLFWFEELRPDDWFAQSDVVDSKIIERFSAIHSQATKGELFNWRKMALGRLAEIIVLDQFSRNIHRSNAEAYKYDSMSLALAQEMVQLGLDQKLETTMRAFVYLPYMHSESLIIHQEAVALFSQTGLEANLAFELQHKKIIERFGRFPHRNEALGRESTPEEKEFLKEHSGF